MAAAGGLGGETALQHLRDLARRTEEDFMLMERGDADPLNEMEVCAVVIDNVRAMDALVAGAALQRESGNREHGSVAGIPLEVLRKLSKKILANGRGGGGGGRPSQFLVLVEILKFVLARQVTENAEEVFLFDTRRCLSFLFNTWQLHSQSVLICHEFFEFCTSHRTSLLHQYSDLVCLGYPTALLAAARWPEKFATHMPCFVQSMVNQSQCIPLMQTILGLPEASFVDGLVPDLLRSVFMCALESPEVGSLCSMIKLILDTFTRTGGTSGGQSDRAKAVFCRHCTDPALVFVANALRLRPRMLVTLQKTLLDLLMAEEEGSGGIVLHKVKASLLREMGIILWEQGASPSRAHFEDTAYQVVDTLETVIHERAHVWQRLQTEDHQTLKLVCASLTALARIVLSHTSLLTRVDLMLKKMCHAKTCHKFVLNRANESLNLVQMPEILGTGD